MKESPQTILLSMLVDRITARVLGRLGLEGQADA
jgi:hypothetical protein